MIFSILSLIAGVIVVQQFSVLPGINWIIVLFMLVGYFAFFRYWRLMFFIIGFLWAIYFSHIRLTDQLSSQIEGIHLQIKGQVVGLPQYDERRVRFDFLVLNEKKSLPRKIRLSWFFPKQQIKAGQYWQLTVKLKKPHGWFNPGGFDYERWLFMENIGATGYVKNKPPPELLGTAPAWQNFTTIRQKIADQLTLLLGESSNKGIIKALTIGDRSEISDEQWNVFRRTGTVHLVAISGLHIGLISGLTYLFIFNLAIKLNISSAQKTAAVCVVVVAVFYSALAGFSLPTQRSLIMLTIAMLAIVLQRNISIVNIIALAMFGVVILDPLSVLSASFWLSFLAVSIIVYSLAARLGKTGYWTGAIKIHCVTAISLSPLLLFYFQQFSIIAPVANFIAVPVVSLVIVPLCFIAVLSMAISIDFAALIIILIDKILQGLWEVLFVMAEFSYAAISISSPPFYILPFALLGIFILLSPRGIPVKWLACLFLLPIILTKQDKPKSGEVTMTLLDVGQGLATVIETANHVLVFDTGAKYSETFNMGNSVIIPFLQYKGIRGIDTLIISHGDNDHIGGAHSIVTQTGVQKILTSVPELLDESDAVKCERGQKWIWDQVVFEIMSPTLGVLNGKNNNSCVLKIRSKEKSILLTGDIEKEAENWLVKWEGDQLKSDILVAPHHGSKTSSTFPFLKQVNASVILIPSGYKNRFSFPHDEVINRYEMLNTRWMSTADEGAIVVKLKGDNLIVESTRTVAERYWN